MKRAGGLYERIAEPENLHLAFWKARRGKDGKADVEAFRQNLDDEIECMRADLLAETMVWGRYHLFTIFDPKERIICAAPFRDRVLHHAIMNVCDPVFERYQIFDSYACRKGRGLHACLERARYYTRRHGWYLKLDVRKYFDSINHAILLQQIGDRFKDNRLVNLMASLLCTYATQPGQGLPIGNLTSQYFANHYLGRLDHLCKETLRVPGYVRYMDDIVLWADNREPLIEWHRQIVDFCHKALSLELKPPCLNKTGLGITMLGYRVFPGMVLLARRSRKRFTDKLQSYWRKIQYGEWGQREFSAHVLPLSAYAGHARSIGFRLGVMYQIGCSP
ncbi:MAG TPA: reverse transcriptase [Verrucomicrobia bacterium]|nr:reverse transcriptase [Verrucomicrobiota bacterium]